MKDWLKYSLSFIVLLFIFGLNGHPAFGIGSQVGLEFAIDAPWRIEPYQNLRGGLRYGPIPIAITFHDAIFDHQRDFGLGKDLADAIGFKNIHVGSLREIRVTQLTKSSSGRPARVTRTFHPSQLTEIERKIGISKINVEPPHEVCWPIKGMNCDKLLDITKSHEWHAMLWYAPQKALKPGENLYLSVSVVTEYEKKERVWTNDLLVHAGEAPLPRFSNLWLYGDLHYHSQMTDNDGESAYSYRNVVRAIGALGMDFTFTTDHASDSIQEDTNLNLSSFLNIPGADKIKLTGVKEARDLNIVRFGVAKSLIYGKHGANEIVAEDVKTGGVASFHSHGVLPQIFMGEEVDAWPQMSAQEQKTGAIIFGDNQLYRWPHGQNPDDDDNDSCLEKADRKKTSQEKANAIQACHTKYSVPLTQGMKNTRDNRTNKPYLVLDEQGAAIREVIGDKVSDEENPEDRSIIFEILSTTAPYPSRQHLVYFPFSSNTGNSAGFVSSKTGVFGGASRRLKEVTTDIEKKGRAFLAHPIDAHKPGNGGPDIVPYSESALNTAWVSPGILGLQFWNEDSRLKSKGPQKKSPTVKFGIPKVDILQKKIAGGEEVPRPVEEMTIKRGGISTIHYDYQLPWQKFPFEWEERLDLRPIEKTQFFDLYHGAYTWDKYLRKGLDQQQTRGLRFLNGGPRKWYMAGGSDAHGDWNFQRKGRFLPCAFTNLTEESAIVSWNLKRLPLLW